MQCCAPCGTHQMLARFWRLALLGSRVARGRLRKLAAGTDDVGSDLADTCMPHDVELGDARAAALLLLPSLQSQRDGIGLADIDSPSGMELRSWLWGEPFCPPNDRDEHEVERCRLALPVYEKRHELLMAPLLLVATNIGLLYSAYWCLLRGLVFEAFGYLFLFVASVAMHGYRDGRSWQWPKQTVTRLVYFLIRLDYMAVLHLSTAVSIYLTEYDQSYWLLSRPFLYSVTLAMSGLLAFSSSHERVSTNGLLMLMFGVILFIPSAILHWDLYSGWMLFAVLMTQCLAYVFIGFLQYRMPYWIAHSLWHVFGCTATFLVLLVRVQPPPPTWL